MRISDWSADVCSSDLKADDGEIHKSKADGVHIRHAQQASMTQADRLQNIQFGLQRQSAERQQYAEHQADRYAQGEIFRDKIRKHAPDHADRSALRRNEVE